MLLKTRLNNVNIHSLLKMLVVTPLIMVTDYIVKAFAISLVMALTLVISEVMVSILRKVTDVRLRTAYYVVITAFSASISEILLKAVSPETAESLGVYLPLCAVSCFVIMKLETVASEVSVGGAFSDALITALQFGGIMLATSLVREFFGKGSLFATPLGDGGIRLFADGIIPILATTPGVIIIMSFGAAAAKYYYNKKEKDSEAE